MSESKTIAAYKCLTNIPVHGLPNPFLYLDISYGHIRIAMNSSKASTLIVAIFTVVLTIHLATINGSQPVFFVLGCRADSIIYRVPQYVVDSVTESRYQHPELLDVTELTTRQQ